MDHAEYHIVYVDNRVSRDLDGKLVQKSESSCADGAKSNSEHMWEDRNPECLKAILGEIEEVRNNLKSILSMFNGGMSLILPISLMVALACVMRTYHLLGSS